VMSIYYSNQVMKIFKFSHHYAPEKVLKKLGPLENNPLGREPLLRKVSDTTLIEEIANTGDEEHRPLNLTFFALPYRNIQSGCISKEKLACRTFFCNTSNDVDKIYNNSHYS